MSSSAGGSGFRPHSELLSQGTAGLAGADHTALGPLDGPESPDDPASGRRARPNQPVDLPDRAGGPPAVAASETYRWLRRAVALAVPLLAVNTVVTAFADSMPAFHHVAVLPAVAVMVAAWAIELAGAGWPRLALIGGVVLPNVWLTLIGHDQANYLFLSLLVAWVGVAGSRAESLTALGLAWATITLDVALIAAAAGSITWMVWTAWSFVLVLAWVMALSLRKQERLVTELRERSQELAMLLTVSRSVASTLEMRPLLDAVFDALGGVLDYSAIGVLTLDEAGDTLTFTHLRAPGAHTSQELLRVRYPVADLGAAWDRLCRDEPVLMGDVRNAPAEAGVLQRVADDERLDGGDGVVRSLMWIPLVVRQRIIGILSIANAAPDAFGARDTALALGIARQAAVAIENARLHARARQAAVLEERQRLSRELHDSVTQALYGISLYAEAAARALKDGDTRPAAANLQEIRDTTQEALGEMRLLLFELRPPVLQEHGLAAALRARLQAVETRAGLVTAFDCQAEERLPPDKEQDLYRIAQEALNNVLKHAHAGRVRVHLGVANGRARLEVADDGVGFEPSLQGADGFGLRGMRERAERLAGMLRIDSAPGQGTRVHVELPR